MASERDQTAVAPRLRMQLLDDRGKRVRVAFHLLPGQAWELDELPAGRVARYWKLMHVEDVREWSEFESRARAARREWGDGGGFAEWTPRLGARRFPGDLLRAVDD